MRKETREKRKERKKERVTPPASFSVCFLLFFLVSFSPLVNIVFHERMSMRKKKKHKRLPLYLFIKREAKKISVYVVIVKQKKIDWFRIE